MSDLVIYDSQNDIATITLNRPEKLNALSIEMGEELRRAWTRFQGSDDKVAILTGSGKAFSVGADLQNPPEIWRFTPGIGVHVDKPVVAAVNGWCVGGGVVLVQFCDLCVVGEDVRFSYPEAKVGLSGGLITSIVARMPHKIAMEFIFACEDLTAHRAYEVGFVNKVVPPEQVMEMARMYAEQLNGYAPMVLTMLKEFVSDTMAKGPSEKAGIARRDTEKLLESADFREGISAFNAKRSPNFRGE